MQKLKITKGQHLINWIGGKRLLRKTIEQLIPKNIGSYIEPFGGGGWVLFYKKKWANLEIYNDLDDRLYNLFNIVKYHPEALLKEYKYSLASRSLFKRSLVDAGITDVQKASTFLYLITRSFGGKGTHFGYSKKGETSGGKSQINLLKRIELIAKRLDTITIENLDFEELINKYDYENAFFYLDPPYSKGAGYKTTSCKDFDHKRLFNLLKKTKGRWLLSYDASDEIKELYKDFVQIEVSRSNSLNNQSSSSLYHELLIKNY